MRRADGTLTRAPGVLLWSGLRAATGNLGARLHLGGALPFVRQLAHHYLMNQRGVHWGVKQIVQHLDAIYDGPAHVLNF
jgi:hypothetical protein